MPIVLGDNFFLIVVWSVESQDARDDRGERCHVGDPGNSGGKGRVHRATVGLLHESTPEVSGADRHSWRRTENRGLISFCFRPQSSTGQHFRLDQKHILRANQVAAAGEPGHVAQHGDNQPHTDRYLNLPHKRNARLLSSREFIITLIILNVKIPRYVRPLHFGIIVFFYIISLFVLITRYQRHL